MRLSVKELCKKFNVSQSKIYTIIGRSEMQKFFVGREHNTRYIEVNEESQAIIEKWANRRTNRTVVMK
jgi:transposase